MPDGALRTRGLGEGGRVAETGKGQGGVFTNESVGVVFAHFGIKSRASCVVNMALVAQLW